MLPDQIALPMFHILKPTELRFCGHFRCDEKRLENIVEIIGEGIFYIRIDMPLVAIGLSFREGSMIQTRSNVAL